MKINIIKLWKAKGQIMEGVVNSIFKKEDVEEIAAERLVICRSNVCGFYDPDGSSEKAYYLGEESCGACGCKLDWKVRSLSSSCGLIEAGLEPLWTAIITEDEETKLKEKIGI